MNATRSVFVKFAAAGAVAVAALAGASAASAGPNWSIGIDLPGIAIGVAEPAPVYYEPAPVYARPAPVYYPPAPVYYEPGPGYRGEGRRAYRADWEGSRRWDRRDWGHDRYDRYERRERYEQRDDRGGWGRRD